MSFGIVREKCSKWVSSYEQIACACDVFSIFVMSNHSGDDDGLHEELDWHEFLTSGERN